MAGRGGDSGSGSYYEYSSFYTFEDSEGDGRNEGKRSKAEVGAGVGGGDDPNASWRKSSIKLKVLQKKKADVGDDESSSGMGGPPEERVTYDKDTLYELFPRNPSLYADLGKLLVGRGGSDIAAMLMVTSFSCLFREFRRVWTPIWRLALLATPAILPSALKNILFNALLRWSVLCVWCASECWCGLRCGRLAFITWSRCEPLYLECLLSCRAAVALCKVEVVLVRSCGG